MAVGLLPAYFAEEVVRPEGRRIGDRLYSATTLWAFTVRLAAFLTFLFAPVWISILVGGILMGVAAMRSLMHHGFDLLIAINMVLYLGLGLYVLPRLLKLIRR